MKKQGFIRTLWGVFDKDQRHYRHRGKISNDIRLASHNKYQLPYTTFVFGEDNYKQLIDNGFDNCELIDKQPIVWDMNKQQYRHKLEALKLGMQKFDEIVYLDIDTMPIKPLPSNFWESLGKKQPIQAILRMYHRKKCFWRKEDQRKTPCAAFIYIGDKSIPDKLIKTWEDMGQSFYEETALMKYMDDSVGGWKGTEFYWNNFEPDFFNLECNTGYSDRSLLKTKNICFEHFNHRIVGGLLRQIDNNKQLSKDCFEI